MTRVENLFYKVTLRLRGIPAHARNLATLHKLLSPTWSNIRPTTATLAKVDLGRMIVAAWCIHLGLILVKKILYVSEVEVVLSRGLPPFLDPG
jgi:hypothetical protein